MVSIPRSRAGDELAGRRERLLFRRCQAGDADARAALVERFMPLARSLAKRYSSSGESLEDLVQVACLGLVKAVDRFDPDKGLRFSSFAVPTILGEIKRHFRDRTWAVHVPRSLNEVALRVDRAIADLTHALGHAPTVAQLGEKLDVSEEEVLEALQVRHARRTASLDAPLGDQSEDPGDTLGGRMVSDDADADYQRADDRLLLAPLLRSLPPREREVMRLRFEEDLTQQEIGELIGVSQMQVSRILRASMQRLRTVADA